MNHHPHTEVLTDYAAGSLPMGASLCVSVHLSACAECRERVRNLEAVGAEMLEELPAAAPESDALDKLLARLDQPEVQVAMPVTPTVAGVPRPLAKLVPEGFEALPWNRVTSALQSVVLPVGDGINQVSLIRMQPGGTIPEHRHAGEELTVVVQGGFSDHGGTYLPGDFVALGEEDRHQPIAHQNEACICLTAQDAPIQFTGFWSRMVNPFLSVDPR